MFPAVNPSLIGVATALVAVANLVACSHVEPYAQVAHTPEAAASAAADARAVFPPFTGLTDLPSPADFTGWMPYALGRVDRTRLGLLNVVSSMGRDRTLYESSLFALTPPLLYGLSRSADHAADRRATLAVGSGLAVWGAVLSRAPAGAENTLAAGAHRLTCLMAESGEFLYTRAELPLPPYQRKSERLSEAIQAYAEVTEKVVEQLQRAEPPKVNEASCSVPGSAYCKARRQQRNTGGGDPTAGLGALRDTIRQNLQLAGERLEDAMRLESRVEFAAPMALLQRSQAVMGDVDNQLRGNRPELLQLKEAMAIVTDATRTLRAAAAQGSGSARPEPPAQIQPLAFPPAQRHWGRAALTEAQRTELRHQFDAAHDALASAVRATHGLKQLQQDKKEGARRLVEDLQCNKAAPLVVTVPGTAASAASAPTPGISPLPSRP